jgi:transketolase
VQKGFFARDQLPRFLRSDGILGSHPDRTQVPGVEVSTGSLGHGLPMAVGVAYALRARGLEDERVFVLTGDAELNEGSNWEAILHAGAAGLGNLTLIVVDNRSSQIEMGEIAAKLRPFGWEAVTVDGRDHDQLRPALERRSSAPTAVVAVV